MHVFLKILTLDTSEVVGKISKNWSGLFQELFTDADNFGIEFPNGIDEYCKATLIGAVFLIVSEFLFFLF